MKRRNTAIVTILSAGVCMALLSGCVAAYPRLDPTRTLPPVVVEKTAAPEETEAPTPSPPAQTPSADTASSASPYDRMGEFIDGAEHYKRYISFKDIHVYEQHGDTFVDAVAQNAYPEALICAVDIVFHQDGEVIARGKLQTRDGQYALRLAAGDSIVFAQVDTDMPLTDKEFDLNFDPALNVLPE